MTTTQVPAPAYDPVARRGNYNPGRQGKQVTSIVYHWIDGYQSVADKIFTDPSMVKSSHFSVEDDSVHQYVRIQDTAFHAGRYDVNLTSVGIEHSAQPGRDASDLTYETSAQLVFQVAKAIGKKAGDLGHLAHRQVKATECPGTLDIDRIVRRAKEIEGAGTPEIVLASAGHGSPDPFTVTVTAAKLYVRFLPNSSAPIALSKTLSRGDRVECLEAVQGNDPYGDGRSTWLHTKVSGLYIWAGGTDYQQDNHSA